MLLSLYTHLVREDGYVSLRVFVVLYGVVLASVLPHQVVAAADLARVHLLQGCEGAESRLHK